eukprot:s859_g27.t1
MLVVILGPCFLSTNLAIFPNKPRRNTGCSPFAVSLRLPYCLRLWLRRDTDIAHPFAQSERLEHSHDMSICLSGRT